jgi:hypothetical protein
MNVTDIRHLAEVNKSETKRIYNPDTDDFTVNFDSKPYTIKALEIQEFPIHIANHIKKHLANHLLHKRGVKINPEADLSKIFEEIEVIL